MRSGKCVDGAMQTDHTLWEALCGLCDSKIDKISTLVSVGMISTPLWLQHLKPVSDVAALVAPILGCIYLSMQIGFKLWGRRKDDE